MSTLIRFVAVAVVAATLGGVGAAIPAQAATMDDGARHAGTTATVRDTAGPRAEWRRSKPFPSEPVCTNDRLLTQHQQVPVSDACFFTNTDGWYYLFWA